jgi:L-ascorbate metabolism protein UlaG (beta-lactamase superfamily)
MGLVDSVRAARMIRPKLTLPLHYQTFPFIEVDTDHWQRLMGAAGFETKVPRPGETLEW